MGGGCLPRRDFVVGGTASALAAFAPSRARSERAGVLRLGAVLPSAASLDGSAAATHLATFGGAVRMGLVLAEEEIGLNAALIGRGIEIAYSSAPTPEAAHRAARRLAATEDIAALIGGFSREEAEALGEFAEEHGLLFFNIGCTSDALRGDACHRNTFHIEASAAMYLDAMVGWFVRSQHRRWYLVYEDSAEGKARYARASAALAERHWGAHEAGRGAVRPGERDFTPIIREIAAARPDLVLLLTDWLAQLDFLAGYEAAGLDHPVTGFPEAATQLRDFFGAARQAAPRAGLGHRAVLWEATLDAYGARELNARFANRWGRPMEAPAWAAYQATKIAFEAALHSGAMDAEGLARFLTSAGAVFDVHKGIGVSFRSWDHQLRQSLFLVKINPAGETRQGLRPQLARASLVGELPAIYMPGTDPVERLDQLGDIRPEMTCG